MKVIPPIKVTDTILTVSGAAEPGAGEVLWNAATVYAVRQVAIRSTTHRRYERTIAGTTATPPESDAANWLDVGPTNRWAMFDTGRNTPTVATSPFVVDLTPGRRINAVFLGGLDADTAEITMLVGGQPVFTKLQNLMLRRTTSWYQYFYGEFKFQPSVVIFDLPPLSGATIRLTLTNSRGPCKCASFVIGSAIDVGRVKYGAATEALNFSRIDRDVFGNVTLVPRRSVPGTQQTLIAPKASVNILRDLRAQLNAVAAVWSGLDDASDGYFEPLLVYGIYRAFDINLSFLDNIEINLKLEEL